jgi:hypothetical protein
MYKMPANDSMPYQANSAALQSGDNSASTNSGMGPALAQGGINAGVGVFQSIAEQERMKRALMQKAMQDEAQGQQNSLQSEGQNQQNTFATMMNMFTKQLLENRRG